MTNTELHSIPTGDKGLKRDAIGYLSNLVIGVASTAPAYSLAATLGFVVAIDGIGVHAPAVLLVSFLPILLIALAYKYLNRADPDAGTTFAWGSRALGPYFGWINGWAIFVADVIVMASLAVIASAYSFSFVGWDAGTTNTPALLIGSTVWIAIMTWICWRGIELSARVQQFLLAAEITILAAFASCRADQGLQRKRHRPLAARQRKLVQPVRDRADPAPRRAAARHLHLLGLGLRRLGERGDRRTRAKRRARPPSCRR